MFNAAALFTVPPVRLSALIEDTPPKFNVPPETATTPVVPALSAPFNVAVPVPDTFSVPPSVVVSDTVSEPPVPTDTEPEFELVARLRLPTTETLAGEKVPLALVVPSACEYPTFCCTRKAPAPVTGVVPKSLVPPPICSVPPLAMAIDPVPPVHTLSELTIKV